MIDDTAENTKRLESKLSKLIMSAGMDFSSCKQIQVRGIVIDFMFVEFDFNNICLISKHFHRILFH